MHACVFISALCTSDVAQTFVYDNNLYFQPNPFTTPVQVTDNRGNKYVYNGIADWLYEGTSFIVCILLPPLEGIVVGRVCLFVRSFVHYACCNFSKTASLIFREFGSYVQHLCQITLLPFQRLRSKFKDKTAVLKIFQL